MDIDRHVSDLQAQLGAAAAAGGPEVQAAAERLAVTLDPAVRMLLLEVLSDAAAEISLGVAPASVEVRLRGREPELVVSGVPAWGTPPAERENRDGRDALTPSSLPPSLSSPGAVDVVESAEDGADEATTRTTLRLPDRIKARVELAAVAEGVSVNTWLVRAATQALEPAPAPMQKAREGESFTGWFR